MRLISALLFAAQLAHGTSDAVEIRQWRMNAGDDPAWAKPDFDDSQWRLSNWPLPGRSQNPEGQIFWARAAIGLPEAVAARPLGLSIPQMLGPFDTYVEGVRIATWGQWTPRPDGPLPRHLAFAIQPGVVHGSIVHVALRFHRFPAGTLYGGLSYGTGLGTRRFYTSHGPLLGPLELLAVRAQRDNLQGIVDDLPWTFELLLRLLVGVICLAMFALRRDRTEYLYLALYCFCRTNFLPFFLVHSDTILLRSLLCVAIVFIDQCNRTFITLFLAQLGPRFRRILLPLAGLSLLGAMTTAFWQATGQTASNMNNLVGAYLLPAASLLVAIGLWRIRDWGGILVVFTLVISNATRLPGFPWSGLIAGRVAGLAVPVSAVSEVIFLLSTITVLYLRFRRDQKRQIVIDRDLAAARLVQESLLSADTLPGFAVDPVYLPASEVGGDFYQTVPGEDGSLLVVVGDVSGKGLPASLLVASVIGAMGHLPSRRPAAVLEHLNLSILGKTRGGFVTCCCVLFEPAGSAIVANAGHLPPFANGVELAVEAGMPLGLTAEAEYHETTTLETSLTLLSDGVLEAENAKGELFGFERMAAISTKPAQEIADTARAWGQNDDITVVTVRRLG